MKHGIPALCALLALAPVAWAPAAWAHAFLDSARPRVGSVNPTPPGEVLLIYTQGVEPDFSTIEVTDSSGASVTTGPAHTADGDKTHLAVPLKKIGPGTYHVVWHVTSVDTHKTQGKFMFSVGP